MKINEIATNSYVIASKLPDANYVINPYGGCTHKCIYCYAEFIKRFTGHAQDVWGDFLDVKVCKKPINLNKIKNSDTVLIGSVTDPYNPYERKYKVTQKILKQLVNCEANIEILTKSDFVLEDMDIIKQFKNIKVGISLNTLDDCFRKLTELRAPSVEKRVKALETLKEAGISTYLFMSPIFPYITDFKAIIERIKSYADYICFENLNLRGAYLPRVLEFIKSYFPNLVDAYNEIYILKDGSYWQNLEKEIIDYCESNNVNYRMYFYHDKIKKQQNIAFKGENYNC
jgi:DNA repair photolyase